jgi:hypothetical protein
MNDLEKDEDDEDDDESEDDETEGDEVMNDGSPESNGSVVNANDRSIDP